MKKPIVLTIAGSDSSGGAGIQADIKTMTVHGVFATSVITALTAQNTLGITNICDVPPDFLRDQLEAVLTDLPPSSTKIGMVSSPELIEVIASELAKFDTPNIVLDPVMVSTSGSRLISEEAVSALTHKLLPIVKLITPNIPEAEVLLSTINDNLLIKNQKDMVKAADIIANRYKCSVLIKGGHSKSGADDYLYDLDKKNGLWYKGEKIHNFNTHGTGCTLSSAIASNLAKGENLCTAIGMSKKYLNGAIAANFNLGHGAGPLDHSYFIDFD